VRLRRATCSDVPLSGPTTAGARDRVCNAAPCNLQCCNAMHEVADHECEENRTRVRVISNDRARKTLHARTLCGQGCGFGPSAVGHTTSVGCIASFLACVRQSRWTVGRIRERTRASRVQTLHRWRTRREFVCTTGTRGVLLKGGHSPSRRELHCTPWHAHWAQPAMLC
jgi:hypothetical protein